LVLVILLGVSALGVGFLGGVFFFTYSGYIDAKLLTPHMSLISELVLPLPGGSFFFVGEDECLSSG